MSERGFFYLKGDDYVRMGRECVWEDDDGVGVGVVLVRFRWCICVFCLLKFMYFWDLRVWDEGSWCEGWCLKGVGSVKCGFIR